MSLVVNTNVSSLNAQRSLSASAVELKTAMERLSSGKKINSAADDAAGFAIAERMTAQIRGLNMAAKNVNDGLSMIATIENATNDITGMLHRMRELAVQGINDTNGSQDRAYLQLEVDSLMAEINRVSSDTQYNGKTVLNGSLAFGGELDARAAVELATSTGSIVFPSHTPGETVYQNDLIEIIAVATQSDGTDVSTSVTWTDVAGNVLGTGATLTHQESTPGLLRLIAEAADTNGALLRSSATYNVEERTFQFTSPTQIIIPDPGSPVSTTWIWDGPVGESADLIAKSVSFSQIEGIYDMPDIGGQEDLTEFTFTIEEAEVIENVQVGLRLDHTYVADLNISLIHPDGTEVLLARRNGGSQNNYGEGTQDCSGNLAYFTDGAAEGISDRTPPYVGEIRPKEPLSAFNGKSTAGDWTLKIIDDWDYDQGTFFCGRLAIETVNSQQFSIKGSHQLSTQEFDWEMRTTVVKKHAESK